ncbi:uncharacterized protein LOC133842683 [Drosophila sulfurigaster albostrigata]|uniref:uncharacterized protein LOC133842683 n=1 Tax=Drosophila sulfurigaster albostrigata TaxID=89887 RepID=UPI002D21C157|nr:uncharacterized protein LOC133842683 [Drosophila sulfurigaster albostrigata]
MEVPLTEFTAIDLERELYAYGLNKEGTKQERYERLFTARHKLNYPHLRPRRPAISKFGARVQLDDFAEIRVYRQAECDILASKLKWRIEQVRRTEDNESLEYFHPEVLERIDRRKTYMINMEEFVVRKNPYVHKIFTIFVSRTTGEDLTLLYARSMVQLATMEEVDSESVDLSLVSNDKKKGEEVKRKVPEKAIISPENIAKALGYILRELKKKTITNYVGLVCDYTRMHMKVVTELIESSGLQMPPLVDDIRDLQRALRNMFAPTSVRIASLLMTELYTEATYNEQMSTICNKNTTKNKTAVAPLDEFIARLSDILRDMWKHEEHEKKSISLVCLNNKMVKIYGRHVSRELPPITYEDCAAGAGLLQLMVFDALWCITPELEPEEIYANPTVSSHAS